MTDCIAELLWFSQPVCTPTKTEQKTWLGDSKAITQGQSFHYCQLIQASAPTITSLFPYELLPIELILESETQTSITVTDMSQSGTLPPAHGTCGIRTSSTSARSTSKPHTANYSQCHSERSENEQTDPLHRRQKETRRVSDQNWHVSCYGTASCLISSYLINYASLILSNELSNTYLISVWLLWNSSLFNLLHFIIVWSCGYYYKVWQLLGITPHCWLNAKPLLHTAYTQILFLFSQTIFLHSYFLICSFFHILSSYLLILSSYLWLIW